jgi:hypothetical protein
MPHDKSHHKKQSTLLQIIEALSALEHHELEELALAYATNHTKTCEICGIGQGEHASEQEIRKRISEMSNDQLASLIAPVAMISQVIQHRH